MKSKVFYLIVAIATMVFCSCESSDIDSAKKEKETNYTIIYNIDYSDYVKVGAKLNESITISEYNELNERVGIQNDDNITYGFKKKYTANPRAVKIAISVSLEATYNGKTDELKRWIAQVFYLEKESNITVTVDGNTMVSASCPIK